MTTTPTSASQIASQIISVLSHSVSLSKSNIFSTTVTALATAADAAALDTTQRTDVVKEVLTTLISISGLSQQEQDELTIVVNACLEPLVNFVDKAVEEIETDATACWAWCGRRFSKKKPSVAAVVKATARIVKNSK